jgi:hypothetical protein
MKGEHDRLKKLEQEIKATKIALAEKTMVIRCHGSVTRFH